MPNFLPTIMFHLATTLYEDGNTMGMLDTLIDESRLVTS
jgi:hypothetical protein